MHIGDIVCRHRVPQTQRHACRACIRTGAILRSPLGNFALLSRHIYPGAQTHGHCLRYSEVRKENYNSFRVHSTKFRCDSVNLSASIYAVCVHVYFVCTRDKLHPLASPHQCRTCVKTNSFISSHNLRIYKVHIFFFFFFWLLLNVKHIICLRQILRRFLLHCGIRSFTDEN